MQAKRCFSGCQPIDFAPQRIVRRHPSKAAPVE
jgi:hypothetical protein